MEQKVIYYKDENNDEFSTARITPKKIDGGYKYLRNGFLSFVLHRFIALPLAFIYTKLRFAQKTVGRSKLKEYKKSALFLYGNHTQASADPLIPNLILFPQRAYFIVHPNNVSMKFFGAFMPYLGALPLPDGAAAYKNFLAAIDHHISKNRCITVYPEAHIWPYYTKIRNFPDTSFSFPCKYNAPAFAFTNVYKKRRFLKKPKIITYIDGPFLPDENLLKKERIKDLRNRVYNAMCERAKLSDCEYISYIKKED